MAEPGALDYFYGMEAEQYTLQYTFYRIAKAIVRIPATM